MISQDLDEDESRKWLHEKELEIDFTENGLRYPYLCFLVYVVIDQECFCFLLRLESLILDDETFRLVGA